MSNKTSDKLPLKMVSLFAGIGGFELGFKQAGIETIMACEIDPIAKHVLKTNFPNISLVDDICDLNDLPDSTDILCAGFPCQDISTIGVKTGLSGERSSLVREVFRLLENKKVEWVIFENVPNIPAKVLTKYQKMIPPLLPKVLWLLQKTLKMKNDSENGCQPRHLLPAPFAHQV